MLDVLRDNSTGGPSSADADGRFVLTVESRPYPAR
jgi:hypothetical protein